MSDANPMVSVIIPNYNHAAYLADAITSVLNQTYRHIEIIVVDDGSTDNSQEVAAQFGDQIHYIKQENQGLSAARNTGIRAARGGYIGLLDADDMYEPHAIQSIVSSLDLAEDADGIYCGYRFVDQNNRVLYQEEARHIPTETLFTSLLNGNFLVPESMFVHRRCYQEVGLFDTALTACEDWDMWLRITKQYKIIFTPHILTRHRVLPGSMSSDPARMLNNRLTVLQKHLGPESLDTEPTCDTQRMAYGRAYLTSAVEYIQYRDNATAYECLKAMAKSYPELLTSLDTFYELGCGDQPKGYRGQFATLDIERNGQILVAMLDRLFKEPALMDGLKKYSAAAYSNVYIALGLLAYGAKQMQKARWFIHRAIAASPRIMFKREIAALYVKSFIVPLVAPGERLADGPSSA